MKNLHGGTPKFRKKKDDPNTVGGEIYYFDDADIDFGLFSESSVIRGLRNIFRGKVRPDPSKKYGQFALHVEPSAKVSCIPLSGKDTGLVQNIIHRPSL